MVLISACGTAVAGGEHTGWPPLSFLYNTHTTVGPCERSRCALSTCTHWKKTPAGGAFGSSWQLWMVDKCWAAAHLVGYFLHLYFPHICYLFLFILLLLTPHKTFTHTQAAAGISLSWGTHTGYPRTVLPSSARWYRGVIDLSVWAAAAQNRRTLRAMALPAPPARGPVGWS